MLGFADAVPSEVLAKRPAKQPGLTSKNPFPQASFNGKPFDQVIKPNQTHDHYSVDENGQTRVLKRQRKTRHLRVRVLLRRQFLQAPLTPRTKTNNVSRRRLWGGRAV